MAGARPSRAATVLERDWQSTVLEAAAAKGWEAFYIPDSKRAGLVGRPKGWPDLALAHEGLGMLLFVENKTDQGKVSPDQRRWINLLTAAGQRVEVWRPSTDWDYIVKILEGDDGAWETYPIQE